MINCGVTKGVIMKLSFIVFAAFLLLDSVVYAQAKTGANDVNTSSSSSSTGQAVWAAPAEQKIRPDAKVETSNLVWNGSSKKVSIAGAGNEHVPFQVVITS